MPFDIEKFTIIIGIVSIVSLFIGIICLIIEVVTLCKVGSIKKNQSEYQKSILFSNTMEEHILFLTKMNMFFRKSVRNFNEEQIRDYLSVILNRIRIIENILPAQYKNHKASCNRLIKLVDKQYKGQYQIEKLKGLNKNLMLGSKVYCVSNLLETHRDINSLIENLNNTLETKHLVP